MEGNNAVAYRLFNNYLSLEICLTVLVEQGIKKDKLVNVPYPIILVITSHHITDTALRECLF